MREEKMTILNRNRAFTGFKGRWFLLLWCFLPSGVFISGVATAAPTVYDPGDLVFTSNDQNMWGEGDAFQLDETRFFGATWNGSSSKIGTIKGTKTTTTVPTNPLWFAWKTCKETVNVLCGDEPAKNEKTITTDTRTGAELTVSTGAGKVGFEVNLKVDSGSVDAQVAFDAGLVVPDNADLKSGEFVSLNSDSDLTGDSLSSTFPTLEASASLVFQMSANATAKGCFFGLGCKTGSVGKSINENIELISFNQDGNGGIEYFDGDPLLNQLLVSALAVNGKDLPTGFPATVDAGFVELTAHLPQPDTNGGLAGDKLKASAQDDLLDVFVDVDNIVSLAITGTDKLFGGSVSLGKLGGFEVGSFDYTLIDVDIGPTIDLVQSFELSPTLMVDLVFSQLVDIAGIGKVMSYSGAWDNLPDIAFFTGDTLVTPTFFLGFQGFRGSAELLNQLLLDIDGELRVSLLSASATIAGVNLGSVGLGNVFNGAVDLFTTPPIFSKRFGMMGFNDVQAASFLVSIAKVPEPGTLTLLGLGLLSLSLTRRKRRTQQQS